MRFVLALVLMMFTHVAAAEEVGPARDVAAIKSFGESWSSAYAAGDLPRLMALYMPDAVLMTANQPMLRGAPAIEGFFKGRLARAEMRLAFEPESVVVQGRQATMIAAFWLCAKSRETGQAFPAKGRSLLVFKKAGGKWLLWRDMDAPATDVGAGPGGVAIACG